MLVVAGHLFDAAAHATPALINQFELVPWGQDLHVDAIHPMSLQSNQPMYMNDLLNTVAVNLSGHEIESQMNSIFYFMLVHVEACTHLEEGIRCYGLPFVRELQSFAIHFCDHTVW